MKLERFRVTNFRSVVDSGWIDVSDITAFLGENESGKTNILLPLWKLHPAGEGGQIDPLSDYPKTRFNEIRTANPKPIFIHAEFLLPDTLAKDIALLIGNSYDPEKVRLTRVQRNYDGKFTVDFPNAVGTDAVEAKTVIEVLESTHRDLQAIKLENDIHLALQKNTQEALALVINELKSLGESAIATLDKIRDIRAIIEEKSAGDVGASDALTLFQKSIPSRFEGLIAKAKNHHPSQLSSATKKVLDALPKFVYYSQYGNLDSEIYLPHVVNNLERAQRGELRGREAAKARTLKVLFNFVKLSPKEILELGSEQSITVRPPNAPHATQEEIDEIARHKRERDILFNGAASELTKKFRDWWKRGDYIFRFSGDGSYFRIWVSDNLRPEEVELEYRSSGLQWFFSFFLVFLAERGDQHRGAILLLDEPGVTLHPLAQEDLFRFFTSISSSNQLVYTSHSAHLVDPDRLCDVRVVYVNDDGETVVSADLRASEADVRRSKSIYPIDAALGLSVSETLLHYAYALLVEGTSDQYYLSYIKERLIAEGRIKPLRELMFVPAGGAKAITTTAPILSLSPDHLPPVILDGDAPGKQVKKSLEQGLYSANPDRLILIDSFTGMQESETEDLFPANLVAEMASRTYRSSEEDFSDVYEAGKPILPQIESFAHKVGIELALGWKVRLAQSVVARARKRPDAIDTTTLERWEHLFENILQNFSQ